MKASAPFNDSRKELLKDLFLSDGGDSVRNVQESLHPASGHFIET